MSSRTREAEKFAAEIEAAGLIVRRKGDKFVVASPTGQLLGSFGTILDRGRTRANVVAQIKRATGIVIEDARTGSRRHSTRKGKPYKNHGGTS